MGGPGSNPIRLNPDDGRPKQAPRMPHDRAPHVLRDYPIPADAEHMPDTLGYDQDKHELIVGSGHIGNVTPSPSRVWAKNPPSKPRLRAILLS